MRCRCARSSAGSTARAWRAAAIAASKRASAAQARDQVQQRVEVELAQPLALGQHPVVVMAGQQFAAIETGVEGRGIGRRIAEEARGLGLELQDIDAESHARD